MSTAYSQSVSSTGGTSPYTYSLTSGSLPTGLSLSGSTISGTPSAQGTYTFAITSTDSKNSTGVISYTVTINAAANLSLTSTSSGTTQTGAAYSQTNVAAGGTGSYTYSVASGSLPAGLSLNSSTGTVSGTPTQAGSFSYTIQVSDGSTTTTKTVSGTISAPTITISPGSLASGTQNSAYSQTVSASGGTSSYTYSVIGSLPAGLSLSSSTGVISGTPSTAGTTTFTIQATDSSTGTGAPFSQTKSYSITISAVGTPLSLTSTSSGTTQTGVAYTQTNVAAGGTGSYTYTVSSGSLPAGLSLDPSTGTVSGTPTQGGSFSYTIQVSDGSTTTTKTVSGTMSAPTITISPTSLPSGTQNSAYNHTVSASGGTSPYTYSVTIGSLPSGLSLDSSTGLISGTPSTTGTTSFTVQATDSSTGTGPFSQTKSYSITISAVDAPLSLSSSSSATTQIGVAYSQTNVASGGMGTYTYTVVSGSLPAGLSLDPSTGTVSGTPTQGGSFSYMIQVSDDTSSATQTLTGTISAPTITTASGSLASATLNSAYNQTISASGGTSPYTYSVVGSLPAGLSLSTSTGVISGTPSTLGTTSFTIQITDSSTGTGPFVLTKSYSITVGCAAGNIPNDSGTACVPGSSSPTSPSNTTPSNQNPVGMKSTGSGCTPFAGQSNGLHLFFLAAVLVQLFNYRRRFSVSRSVAAFLGLVVFFSGVWVLPFSNSAFATPTGSLDVEQFEAVPPGAGFLNAPYGTIKTLPHQWSFGLTLSYAKSPLKVVPGSSDDTRAAGPVVPKLRRWELNGLYQLTKSIDIEAAVPFLVTTMGTPTWLVGNRAESDVVKTTLGDPRLTTAIGLIQTPNFGAKFRFTAFIPGGGWEAFHGEENPRWQPELATDFKVSQSTRMGVHLGYLMRKSSNVMNVVNGNAIRYGAWLEGHLTGPLEWIAHYYGSQQSSAQLDPLDNTKTIGSSSNYCPSELLSGLRTASKNFELPLAGGMGLTSAVGSPSYRVVMQLGIIH